MAGITFDKGETKIRPGVYVRFYSNQTPNIPISGVAGCLIDTNWGPLNTATLINNIPQAELYFGGGENIEIVRQALYGGATACQVVRIGDEATADAAYLDVEDTAGTPVQVLTISAKYKGTGGNDISVTIRDHPAASSTTRQLLVYFDGVLVETFLFAKGDSGDGEPQALIDAVTSKGSNFIEIEFSEGAPGNGTLESLTSAFLTLGTDVDAVSGVDFTNGMEALDDVAIETIAAATEDSSIHSSIAAQVQEWRLGGKRVIAVVGEPTSVSFDDRKENAAAINYEGVVYVGNGFVGNGGVQIEGQNAAARIAGMIASLPINASLTHAPISNAFGIVDSLNNEEHEEAILAGVLVFSSNASGVIVVEYGINSLSTLSAGQDAGWKKIRRVRTRDTLMNNVAVVLDSMIGSIPNSPIGRELIIVAANGEASKLVDNGALTSCVISIDDENPPEGDSIWLKAAVIDNDSAEKFYVSFGFEF